MIPGKNMHQMKLKMTYCYFHETKGEEYFGFKLDRETCITLYDAQSTTEEPVRRGNKQFEDMRYRDIEFPLGLSEDKNTNYVFML